MSLTAAVVPLARAYAQGAKFGGLTARRIRDSPRAPPCITASIRHAFSRDLERGRAPAAKYFPARACRRVRLRPTAASALFRDGRLQLAGTLQHCTVHITSLPAFFSLLHAHAPSALNFEDEMPQHAPPHALFGTAAAAAARMGSDRMHGYTGPAAARSCALHFASFCAHTKRRHSSLPGDSVLLLLRPVSPPRRAALPAPRYVKPPRTRLVPFARAQLPLYVVSKLSAVPAAAFWDVPCSRPRLRRAASGSAHDNNKLRSDGRVLTRGRQGAYPHEAVSAWTHPNEALRESGQRSLAMDGAARAGARAQPQRGQKAKPCMLAPLLRHAAQQPWLRTPAS
ncbi:hypothetical protein VTO73DRAFT_2864 [Trametes versicolor]